jgi:AcrR family transcriptional regulator
MKSLRVDIGSIRREQIVDAAAAIIAEQGIQNLSLSEIEAKAGMSRGQLTYYFKTKEDILLAVFDRMLRQMHEGAEAGTFIAGMRERLGWERIQFLVRHILLDHPGNPTFGALQHTFLAQLGHREDFRQRLAALYEEWRSHTAGDFSDELARRPANKKASPRALATLVQAVMHGLFVQRAADPTAYDQREVVDLLLDMVETYLGANGRAAPRPKSRTNGRRPPADAGPDEPPKAKP